MLHQGFVADAVSLAQCVLRQTLTATIAVSTESVLDWKTQLVGWGGISVPSTTPASSCRLPQHAALLLPCSNKQGRSHGSTCTKRGPWYPDGFTLIKTNSGITVKAIFSAQTAKQRHYSGTTASLSISHTWQPSTFGKLWWLSIGMACTFVGLPYW
jgi:hypothetical protein